MASTPDAPNPKELANAQNSQSMWASMVNSVTGNANTNNPYGSTSNTISGYIPYTDPYTGKTTQIPQWTQNTKLSDAQQRIFDAENQAKLAMGGLANQQLTAAQQKLAQPFDQTGLQPWQTYGAGPDLQEADPAYRKQIEDSMMASYRRQADPAAAAEDARLAARGAGDKQTYNVGLRRGDEAAEASRQAFTQAGGEARAEAEGINKPRQQEWLNANLGVDQANALRQSQFSMNSAERNQIVNEIAAFLGGGQATIPSQTPWQGGQVNPFDIAGAEMNNYNIEAKNAANTNSGIFNTIGAIVGAANPVGWAMNKWGS